MKDTIVKLSKNIYGIFVSYAVLVGAVVAIIYLIGFLFGGNIGEVMAITGANIMKKTAMPTAAIGSLAGMVSFYYEGHALTISDEDEDKDNEE